MSMWDYQQDVGGADGNLVGYDVEATDGHIGHIDEATDGGRRGDRRRHRLLDLRQEADDPSRSRRHIDAHDGTVYVG